MQNNTTFDTQVGEGKLNCPVELAPNPVAKCMRLCDKENGSI